LQYFFFVLVELPVFAVYLNFAFNWFLW